MAGFSGAPKLGIAGAIAWLLLSPITAWSTDRGLVQRIGHPSGPVAEAVAEQVTIIPFSPRVNASKTPIVLEAGIAFVDAQGHVRGLRPVQRRAIRRAYDAGRTIVILNASTHDVEALHTLIREGVIHESSTDPVLLAYALRREGHQPVARALTTLRPAPDETRNADDDAEAFAHAVGVVVGELSHPPVSARVGESLEDCAAPCWLDTGVQSTVLSTSSSQGVYNTPVEVFSLHACHDSTDHYAVLAGGDWTPTTAKFESASKGDGTLRVDDGKLVVDWQTEFFECNGTDFGTSICRYINYPLQYELKMLPPTTGTVVQLDAAPAATQGTGATYSSGVSFSIDGRVFVSGMGPSAGVQAGVTWTNTTTVSVPALLVEASIKGNEGRSTIYKYCTVGNNSAECTSEIQLSSNLICKHFKYEKDSPETGQTPDGSLSNRAQTVHWQADSNTRTVGSTFDITVSFQADMATTETRFWDGKFGGVSGYCNIFFCSCTAQTTTSPLNQIHTFKMPFPLKKCDSSALGDDENLPVRPDGVGIE